MEEGVHRLKRRRWQPDHATHWPRNRGTSQLDAPDRLWIKPREHGFNRAVDAFGNAVDAAYDAGRSLFPEALGWSALSAGQHILNSRSPGAPDGFRHRGRAVADDVARVGPGARKDAVVPVFQHVIEEVGLVHRPQKVVHCNRAIQVQRLDRLCQLAYVLCSMLAKGLAQ